MSAGVSPGLGSEQMLEIARAHMAAEDRHDLEDTVRCFSEDCYYLVPGLGIELRGREQIREWYADLFAAVPDMSNANERYWAFPSETDQFVLYQADMQGTHLGTWQGWRATGRRFSTSMLVRIPITPEGLMRAEEVYFDGSHLFRQLGIVPQAGSREERALQRLHAFGVAAQRVAHTALAATAGRRTAQPPSGGSS